LSDLSETVTAEYNRQIKVLGLLCALLVFGSISSGLILFVWLGYQAIPALENTLVSFTLGGGSLCVTGFERGLAIALSIAGILFISLIVSIVCLIVQKEAALKVSRALFRKELELLERDEQLKRADR